MTDPIYIITNSSTENSFVELTSSDDKLALRVADYHMNIERKKKMKEIIS